MSSLQPAMSVPTPTPMHCAAAQVGRTSISQQSPRLIPWTASLQVAPGSDPKRFHSFCGPVVRGVAEPLQQHLAPAGQFAPRQANTLGIGPPGVPLVVAPGGATSSRRSASAQRSRPFASMPSPPVPSTCRMRSMPSTNFDSNVIVETTQGSSPSAGSPSQKCSTVPTPGHANRERRSTGWLPQQTQGRRTVPIQSTGGFISDDVLIRGASAQCGGSNNESSSMENWFMYDMQSKIVDTQRQISETHREIQEAHRRERCLLDQLRDAQELAHKRELRIVRLEVALAAVRSETECELVRTVSRKEKVLETSTSAVRSDGREADSVSENHSELLQCEHTEQLLRRRLSDLDRAMVTDTLGHDPRICAGFKGPAIDNIGHEPRMSAGFKSPAVQRPSAANDRDVEMSPASTATISPNPHVHEEADAAVFDAEGRATVMVARAALQSCPSPLRSDDWAGGTGGVPPPPPPGPQS